MHIFLRNAFAMVQTLLFATEEYRLLFSMVQTFICHRRVPPTVYLGETNLFKEWKLHFSIRW